MVLSRRSIFLGYIVDTKRKNNVLTSTIPPTNAMRQLRQRARSCFQNAFRRAFVFAPHSRLNVPRMALTSTFRLATKYVGILFPAHLYKNYTKIKSCLYRTRTNRTFYFKPIYVNKNISPFRH